MSDTCEECGHHFFGFGDRVRLVQNHLLTGQIIDERGWHSEYLVRLGATVTTLWFQNCELEPDPDFGPPQSTSAPIPAEEGNNIISLADRIAGRAAAGGIH